MTIRSKYRCFLMEFVKIISNKRGERGGGVGGGQAEGKKGKKGNNLWEQGFIIGSYLNQGNKISLMNRANYHLATSYWLGKKRTRDDLSIFDVFVFPSLFQGNKKRSL